LKLLDTAYQNEHSTFRGLCSTNLMVSNQTIGFVICFSTGRAFLRARSRRVADIFLQLRFVFSHITNVTTITIIVVSFFRDFVSPAAV